MSRLTRGAEMAKWTVYKKALGIGRLVLLVFLGSFTFSGGCQTNFIYRPMRQLEATPADIQLDYEKLQLTSDGGVGISGWYVPSSPSRGVVLFCHGNAGNISHGLESIQVFNSMGLDVLIFDYQGYGLSEGTPSEAGTYADSEAAWQYLTEVKGIAPERIIIFGRSLGGAVAARLATVYRPAGLVVEAAFTSLPDLAGDIFPYMPMRLVMWFEYETVESIAKVNCPVLVAHSPKDDLISFAHGRRLFEAAPEPKQFIELSGSHGSGFYGSEKSYISGWKKFLATCGLDW